VAFAKKVSGSKEFRRGQRVLEKSKYGLGQPLLYQNLGKNFSDLELSEKARLHFSSIPTCKLLIPDSKYSLIDSLMLLVSFNAMIDVRYLRNMSFPLFSFVSGREEIEKRVADYPVGELSAILISHDTSRTELVTWIEENWKEIKEDNKKLGKFQTTHIPKNIELGEEIGKLLDEGNSYSEIAKIMSERYPDDERMADYNQIKTIYSRYKKYMVESMRSIVKLNFLSGNTK